MVGKNVRIYGVQIPRKCAESKHIYSCSPFNQSSLPGSYCHPSGRGKLLILPRQCFLENLFAPPAQKG